MINRVLLMCFMLYVLLTAENFQNHKMRLILKASSSIVLILAAGQFILSLGVYLAELVK